MGFLDELIEQYRQIENALALLLMQTQAKIAEMERLNMDENKTNDVMSDSQRKGIQVPFAAYETQAERFQQEKQALLDRFDAEKDKMRKHYKHIVMLIAIPFAAFIIALFGTVIWFFNNYDFASYQQDGDGINNYLNGSSQGDMTYEPTYPGDYLEKSLTGEGNLDQ